MRSGPDPTVYKGFGPDQMHKGSPLKAIRKCSDSGPKSIQIANAMPIHSRVNWV